MRNGWGVNIDWNVKVTKDDGRYFRGEKVEKPYGEVVEKSWQWAKRPVNYCNPQTNWILWICILRKCTRCVRETAIKVLIYTIQTNTQNSLRFQIPIFVVVLSLILYPIYLKLMRNWDPYGKRSQKSLKIFAPIPCVSHHLSL